MLRNLSPKHSWRNNPASIIKNREFTTIKNRKFIALIAKNPHDIEPTICPPGNAEDCVLGMDFAVLPVKIKGKAVGRVYVGYE